MWRPFSRLSLRLRVLILAVLIGAPGLFESCRSQPTSTGALPENWGVRKTIPFEDIQNKFAEPDMIYAPFIFWFWDEPLDPVKMAGMSRVMAEQRFSPGYAHARKSMVGTPDLPEADWLGDRWFEAFGAALNEAEAKKNYLGYCDEYWWPSFQANGRVLAANPGLRTVSLSWKTVDIPEGPGESTFSTPTATLEPTARTSTTSTPVSLRHSSRSLSSPTPVALATGSAAPSRVTSSTTRATTAGVWPGRRRSTSATGAATGGNRPVASADTNEGSALTLVFKPYEAYWLVFDPKKEAHSGSAERKPDIEVVATIDGPWKIICDTTIQPVTECPTTPPAEFAQGVEKPLEDWSAWGLQKFSGLLDYTKTFLLEKPGKSLQLDLGKVGPVRLVQFQ